MDEEKKYEDKKETHPKEDYKKEDSYKSKKKQKQQKKPRKTEKVKNSRPPKKWRNFEACWNQCVKNGDDVLFQACKAHLKSKGWLDKPEKWIDGIINFGIKVE